VDVVVECARLLSVDLGGPLGYGHWVGESTRLPAVRPTPPHRLDDVLRRPGGQKRSGPPLAEGVGLEVHRVDTCVRKELVAQLPG
jgi:hypothetical protein